MYLPSQMVCYMYMISIILMELLIIHSRISYFHWGGIIIMAEISVSCICIQIFIGHSDGIFARFNGNVDGIKWQSVNSSEQNGR